ncbi:hypothetical protein IQ07DRAFT_588585 [Pyrenochaeta sp. DS3sAY3a]|nr:hypothetical protein IQ07DRAFT_588585 [Pyrenochaeta sp. DS3sAY3a]
MRSITPIAFLAASVAAQEYATVIDLFQVQTSLTIVGSSAGTATYTNNCPSGTGISAIPTDLRKR